MTDPNIKSSDDGGTLDSFQYLTKFFTTFDQERFEEESTKNSGGYDIYLEDLKKIPEDELRKVRKITQKDLDLNQLKLYFQLKNEFDLMFGENYYEENEIIRFIIGLKGDIDKIKEVMIETEEWRRSFRVKEITADEFVETGFNKILYLLCKDKYNRPIIYFRLSNYQPDRIEIERFVRYLVFIMETAIKRY